MTHIRTNHPVSLYTAGKSKPETGLDRLVILGWKGNTTTGRIAHSTRCFSLPMWSPSLQGPDIGYLEILVSALEEIQRKIAHKYATEQLDMGYQLVEIPGYLVSPEAALLCYQEEQEETTGRGKLSGEQIGKWFSERLAPLVLENIATKNGFLKEGYSMSAEEEKKCLQGVAGYKAVLERLSQPVPRVEIAAAKQLVAALGLLGREEGERDMVARKLGRKLEGIISPKESSREIGLVDLM